MVKVEGSCDTCGNAFTDDELWQYISFPKKLKDLRDNPDYLPSVIDGPHLCNQCKNIIETIKNEVLEEYHILRQEEVERRIKQFHETKRRV